MQNLSNDNDLCLQLSASEEDAELLKKLYQPVDPSYFADKQDAISQEERNPLKRIYTWANTSPAVPYIKKVNLNRVGHDEMDLSDPGSKDAIEIGIKFTF